MWSFTKFSKYLKVLLCCLIFLVERHAISGDEWTDTERFNSNRVVM